MNEAGDWRQMYEQQLLELEAKEVRTAERMRRMRQDAAESRSSRRIQVGRKTRALHSCMHQSRMPRVPDTPAGGGCLASEAQRQAKDVAWQGSAAAVVTRPHP